MAADTTVYDAVLKTVYPRPLLNLLVTDVALLKSFQRKEKEVWEGKTGMQWPLQVGRNEGFGFGRSRGPISEAQSMLFTYLNVPCRFGWGRINIDSVLMKTAKSNRGSFVRALQSEMDGLRAAFTHDLNRIIWGDGRGILAYIDGASDGAADITCDAPGGVAGDVNGTRFIQRNQKIALLSSAGAFTGVKTVSSVAQDATMATITTTTPVSATEGPDNGFIVRAPNLSITSAGDTSYMLEPMGLRGMVDDSGVVADYFGINRSVYDIACSTVIGSVGALNTDVIQQGIDVASQVGEGRITEHWCHHSVRRAYLAILVANRRYLSTSGANKHDAGFKGNAIESEIEFGGMPVHVDRDAPYGTWFGLDTRYFLNFENTPGEWVDEDGAVLSRVHGSDVFEAVWRWFGQFCCEKPNASFRLDGITANLVVTHVR
jgi:hypothetical protein